MNFKIKIQFLLLSIIFIAGCKKGDETSALLGLNKQNLKGDIAVDEPILLPNDGPHRNAINVYYFLPSNVDKPISGAEDRIARVLAYTDKWYGQQMEKNGFGNKYPLYELDAISDLLPLELAHIRVFLTMKIIKGAYPASRYNSEEGLKLASQEIETYLKNNYKPSKKSEHSLVFFPGTSDGNIITATGPSKFVTCSAPEKMAFALDYDGYDSQDLNGIKPSGKAFNYTFGHLLHELGHCLNLSHNRGKASEASLGTALMSNGDIELSDKLYLTKSDCTILNYCQALNPNRITNFYCPYNFNLKNISMEWDKANRLITVKGLYNTTIGVAAINYTHLNKTTTTASDKNADYEGISWVKEQNQSAGDVSFTAQMSYDDFIVKKNGTAYQLTVSFLLNNGSQVKYKLYYYIDGGVPSFLSGAVPDEPFQIDNSKWIINAYSSQYAPYSNYTGPAFRLIDRNAATTWLPDTRTMGLYPQEVLIDCRETTTANVFYLSQYAGSGSPSGFNFEVQLSNNGVNFWVAGNYNSAKGTTPPREYFNLSKNESFRYFKLVMVKSLDQQYPLTKGYNIGEVGFLKK